MERQADLLHKLSDGGDKLFPLRKLDKAVALAMGAMLAEKEGVVQIKIEELCNATGYTEGYVKSSVEKLAMTGFFKLKSFNRVFGLQACWPDREGMKVVGMR